MFPLFTPPALVAQVPQPNPWVELLVGSTRPFPSCHFYVFGATGDLVSKRAVREALVQLAESHTLEGGRDPFILLGQQTVPAGPYLAGFRTGDAESKPITQEGFEAFTKLARLDRPGAQIIGLSVKDAPDYQKLSPELGEDNAVFYGALPPKLYGVFLDNLRLSGLSRQPAGGFRRILLEKPFGNESSEARALNEKLIHDFQPGQVLLVDHFLAYPGMTNMLSFRSDPVVDEALCSKYVESFDVKVLESIKSNDRPYFRDTGLVKDMVQNHAIQVFSTMACDLPQEESAEALRGQRERVVQAIEVDEASCRRGQFEGFNDPSQGSPAGASPSQAETYVSFRFKVHSPRWNEVPFRLVNAKGVDHKRSGVDIRLRALPEKLASRWAVPASQPAVIHTTMNPIARIWVDFPSSGKSLEIAYDEHVPNRPPYATLFCQAIRGESAIFATPAESLAAWRVADQLTTVLHKRPLISYKAGVSIDQIDDR
jgi:glucose-6-phosphate 1-dehydrogenase